MYPASISTDITGDAKGDWIFIGEGGMVTFVDFRAIKSTTDPGINNPFGDPSRVKRVQAGDFGVRPAMLMLDPDAVLESGMQPTGSKSNDREDLLYIAGGVQGLWAMRANTSMTSTARNDIVRIDDSSTGSVGVQDSRRYCNQLEVVDLFGTDYLLATFGEKNGQSRLRFYELSDVRDRLDWTAGNRPAQLAADGTGYELAPTWDVVLGERPNFPFLSGLPSSAEAYPLGIAVDQNLADTTCLEAIYVAMSSHGVLRVTPVCNAGGTSITGWQTAWGPVFGDQSSRELASGPLYGNPYFYAMTRSVEFNQFDRSEAPVFADVAVDDDPGSHFLYCAVDHLNWVRFDLGGVWSDAMPIDHHEGEAIMIRREASWDGDGGESALSS